MRDEQAIIRSPLSRPFTSEGLTVQVEIYRLEAREAWILEVVDEEGGSTVWEETFATDKAALSEFLAGVEELGLASLIDPGGSDVATVH
ncbi:MAG: hypothetical protein DI527_14720 [Chelatococcus sp.]|nr:MAG: hypothetical protein DI527_14720 [Chelatococcus sp.]